MELLARKLGKDVTSIILQCRTHKLNTNLTNSKQYIKIHIMDKDFRAINNRTQESVIISETDYVIEYIVSTDISSLE